MAEQLPVALAMMTAGELRYETHESILAAHIDRAISRHYVVQNGPYLDNGRNELVRVFNDPLVRDVCTHLLMVDSDVVFGPEHVRALYEAATERAVVGGVYYSNFEGTLKPIVYDWTTNEVGLKTLEVIEGWEDGWPLWPTGHSGSGPDPIVRVEAIGAGFLMIRYEVLDVLESIHGEPQPWFSEPVVDGIHFGEDLAFCLRAKDAGFGVWAHRGVEVAHIKAAIIGSRPGFRLNP